MDISPATIQDIPELLKLVHSAYRGEGSKRGWTSEAHLLDGSRTTAAVLESQIERKDSVIFKYRDLTEFPNGRMLGCVHVEKVEKKGEAKCYVRLLTVSPELQAKGIGKKLLTTSHDWAVENHCSALMMTVLSARTELCAWYERHGYQFTGEKEPFFTDPDFGIPKTHLEFNVYEKRL